jgi:hypothetical protein
MSASHEPSMADEIEEPDPEAEVMAVEDTMLNPPDYDSRADSDVLELMSWG